MGKYVKIRTILELAICCAIISAGYVICEECKGQLNGNYVTETCNVGGCCIPSDESGDTLCCIPTLTIILVSVFIGGTIVIIITVLVCCAICRYRNKRKLRRRLEERRQRQRERDEERQRRLMMDPFCNGDPFQTPVEEVSETVSAQPPRYHGHASDTTRLNLGSLTTENSLPPPYPNTPPPAYYSRMSTRYPTISSFRLSTHIEDSRETTSVNGNTNHANERTFTEISSINVSPPTLPPHLVATRINTDAVFIRDLSRQTTSRADTNVLTLEDLETVELNHELRSITDVNQASRMATNNEFHQPNSEGHPNNLNSQTSGAKIESRMSKKPGSQASMKTEQRVLSKSESRQSSKIESQMTASRLSSKTESRMSTKPASRLSTTESRISIKPTSRVSSKVESRMSSKPVSRISETESRISSKPESEMSIHLESRMSNKTMHPILENEITDVNIKRATFIKSTVAIETGDKARDDNKSRARSTAFNKVKSIKSDDMVVKTLDFV